MSKNNTVQILLTALDKGFSTAINQGKAKLGELGKKADTVKKKSLSGFGKALLDGFDQAIDKANKKVKSLGTTADGVKKKFGGLKTAITGAFAGLSIAVVIKQLWDAGVAAQSITKAFKGILGSAQAANEEIRFIKDLSESLGKDYVSVANSYKLILAAAQGTAVQGRSVREFLTATLETATVLGASADQIDRAFIQVSQGIGRGKFELEDLKTIAEALPGVGFGDFAAAMGKNTAEFYDMISAGEVLTDEFLPKLSKALHEKFGDAARESADDAAENLNRFKNAWQELKDNVANSGFLETATDYIKRMTAALKDPAVLQQVKDFATSVLMFIDLVGRFALGVKAVFEGVSAYLLTVFGLYMKVAQGVTWLTDKIGLTTNASEEFKLMSEAAFGGAGELAGKATASFSGMVNGLSSVKTEYKDVGKEAGLTFDGIASNAKKSGDAQEKHTKDALKSMKKEYEKYVKEVNKLQEDITGRTRDLAAELREMGRSGMSDIGAWKDRRKEAQEYERAAKEAAEAGDYSAAVELADKAKSAYKSLNEEVKAGDQVLVSQSEALKISMSGVESAGNLAIDALLKQQEAAQAAADALDDESGGKFSGLDKSVDETTAKVKTMEESVVKVGDKWVNVWKENGKAGKKVLDDFDYSIKKLDGTSITVYVEEVTKRALGGLIQKFATGGKLAGYGGGDKIPALLEAGEFIIRKEAVKMFGTGTFSMLNSFRLPKFQVGGPVGALAAAGSGGGGQSVTFNLFDQATGASAKVRADSQMDADSFTRIMKRKFRLRSGK